ncbi:hypothetical protein [Flectobacillus roseus]|uniref:hypothetical protein n=1 Tax=Flectobacillus roseus TaxID=502259 RepID=UPI0024B6DA1A|nr:hypothetical protein [Flectobacillus roseus]MDI9871706.1 hypothetical protein [Flectobacillus roseus]
MTGENFRNHNIFEKIEQLKLAISDEKTKDNFSVDNHLFVKSAIEFILERLRATIPTIVVESELNGISTEIEAATNQINSFIVSVNHGYIQNAINNLSSAINKAKQLPINLIESQTDYSFNIAVFQDVIDKTLTSLTLEKQKLKVDLEGLQQDLKDKSSQIQNLNEQLLIKEKEMQNMLSKYNSDFANFKIETTSSVENIRTDFVGKLESDRKVYKENFELELKSNKTVFEEHVDSLNDRSENTLQNLNDKLSEAKKIVNIVGNVGVTGNYQNIANEHKRSANYLRGLALSFMVVMSILLICTIIDLSNKEFNLYKSLIRILAAAILSYPAVYCARESNKHRQLENQNRRLELELASIGPFIELLDDNVKQQIKEELVRKYFGNTNNTNDNKVDEEISINGLEKILNAILPYLKK